MAPITWEELSEQGKLSILLIPGTKLYGYCNGYFGRDSYATKTVVASGFVGDTPWVVCSGGWSGDRPEYAEGFSSESVVNWIKPEEEDDDDDSPLY